MSARDLWLRFTPRRILGRLQHALDRVLVQDKVVFFRCDPLECGGPPRGELIEADADLYERWRRTEQDFPWPSPEEGRRRFAAGHRPFALVAEGQPRCYGWISVMRTFWLNELAENCSTDTPMTWIWNCVTPAAMRNRGHYTGFLKALRQNFRDRDLLVYCHARNTPSIRAIGRAGFMPWATVTRRHDRTKVDILQSGFHGKLHAGPRSD